MNRNDGSRPFSGRLAIRLSATIATFALGALAVFLVQPAAHADSGEVDMPGGGGSLTVTTGDSVDFKLTGSIPFTSTGLLFCGPGVPAKVSGCPGGKGEVIKKGGSQSITFNQSGNYTFAWAAEFVAGPGSQSTGSATIAVVDPPPPPDSSTPADPGSPTDGGTPTDGSTPTDGTTPTGAGTGTGTGTGATGPSSSKSPTGGVTLGSGSHGGGITIGAGQTGNGQNDIPLGFNAPPPDPNQPTPTIPDAGTGRGTIPTDHNGSPITSGASSSQTLVEVANATPVSKSRPTSLAIVSIGVLAVVSSLYAYRRLGESVQRPGH